MRLCPRLYRRLRYAHLIFCFYGIGLASILTVLYFTANLLHTINRKYKGFENSSYPLSWRYTAEIPSSCRPVLTDQCGSTWQTNYCSFHQSSLKSPNTAKFLSYYCNREACGGVGNRTLGLVSLFYLAMLTNRTFLIHWGGPGKLEEYLEPNQIAWSLPLDSLGNFRKSYWGVSGPPSGYNDSRIESKTQFQNWTSYANFDAYLDRLDAIGTIWSFAEYLWTNPFLSERARLLRIPTSPWKMLGCAFHFLFQQSRIMKAALKEAKNSLSLQPPHLGIHIRTSDHHFVDPNEQPYKSRNTSSFFVCALRQSTVIRDNIGSTMKLKWFLATDDQAVKAIAREKYLNEVVTLNFRPKHIAYTHGSDEETVIRDVFVDLFLLAESNYLLLTANSTLSRLAAAVGLHSDKTTADGEQCSVNETSLLQIIPRVSSRS